MKITPERLAEIRGRCEEATKGPWSETSYIEGPGIPTSPAVSGGGVLVARSHPCLMKPLIKCHRDMKFVANSRSDVPDLLAALEVAVEALEKITESERHGAFTGDALIAVHALQQIGWREKAVDRDWET